MRRLKNRDYLLFKGIATNTTRRMVDFMRDENFLIFFSDALKWTNVFFFPGPLALNHFLFYFFFIQCTTVLS